MRKMALTPKDRELIRAARETLDSLYVENRHEVSAALRTKKGNIYTGIHIETKVGFADVCGEVAAICHAVAHGEREFDAIVAMWRGEKSYEIPSPCGRCREVISDFGEDTWVILGTPESPYKARVSELLPLKND
jgi:cytidine deaminase